MYLAYTTFKYLHVIFAIASIVLFALRGAVMLLAPKPLSGRIWKVLPHVIDTCLLGFGVLLAVLLQLNPIHTLWLFTKLICVIAYIVLGVLAFRVTRPKWLKVLLFSAAILLFCFIISIAILKTPWGILSKI